MNDELKAQIFSYLDELRESGRVNMWGCGPYLMDEFGLSRHEARDIFLEWIDVNRSVPC